MDYCWAAGKSAATIFSDEFNELAFHYCLIYSSTNVEVVPLSFLPAVFPKCPTCDADVWRDYYKLIDRIRSADRVATERPMSSLLHAKVTCPACGSAALLSDLKDDRGLFLSRTWVAFENTPCSLRSEWVRMFEEATGWKHRVLEYPYSIHRNENSDADV